MAPFLFLLFLAEDVSNDSNDIFGVVRSLLAFLHVLDHQLALRSFLKAQNDDGAYFRASEVVM